MGNTVVAVPSERWPLAATDLYQVLDTSDVPGGVVNIVTGMRDELAEVLAAHDDVDGIWYFGSAEGSGRRSSGCRAGNMKRTWVTYGREPRLVRPASRARGEEFLRAGHPGQEHLGAVRGEGLSSPSQSCPQRLTPISPFQPRPIGDFPDHPGIVEMA